MNAKEAIERSVSHNEIVTLTVTLTDPSVITDLRGAAGDWTRGNDRIEFWGTDENGNAWRVHVIV